MTKPSEFFVGVIDFFAILLPGAIATALLAPRFSAAASALLQLPSSEAGQWVVFLVSAYFLGHLIFLLGSYLDPLYNWLRERWAPYDNESAFQCAKRLRDDLILETERKALNPFQWSRSVLLIKCPAAAEDVHRLEADSKFFRSLLVVCLLATLLFLAEAAYSASAVALALVLPCFARYYERRLKCTTQAYLHLITLYRLGQLTPGKAAAGDND